MPKRASDNSQLNKEDYEAMSERDSAAPIGQFKRAPDETLKKRRIVMTKRSPQLVPGGIATPLASGDYSSPSSSVGLPSSNPFGGVKLNSSAKPTFSFNSSSKSGASGFTFGSALNSDTAAANPAPFSFGSSSFTQSAPSTAVPSESSSATHEKHRLDQLREAMIERRREAREDGTQSDLLLDIQSYIAHHAAIVPPISDVSNSFKPPATTEPMAPVVSPPASKPFGNFAFSSNSGSGNSAVTVDKPKPSFSFNATATSTSSNAGGSAIDKNNNNNNTKNDDDDDIIPSEPPEEVERAPDPDYLVLLEISKAKYYAMDEGHWKGYGAGPLRIEQHTTQEFRRIVIRDATGKVQLNIRIAQGMDFKDKEVKSGSGVKKYILFKAKRSIEQGEENLMIQTRATEYDKLLNKLREAAK